MNSILFDTLKLARRLEGAGFSAKQAGDTAEALADSLREADGLATKADLLAVIAELKAEIYRALWLQAAGIVGVMSAIAALIKVLT